jgi:hypothetical protein
MGHEFGPILLKNLVVYYCIQGYIYLFGVIDMERKFMVSDLIIGNELAAYGITKPNTEWRVVENLANARIKIITPELVAFEAFMIGGREVLVSLKSNGQIKRTNYYNVNENYFDLVLYDNEQLSKHLPLLFYFE